MSSVLSQSADGSENASCTYINGFHATGALLKLLHDSSMDMQVYALRKLIGCVSRQWFEIADHLPRLEQLRANEDFQERNLCALILSMVFYYLNEHTKAIHYALEAGSQFDIASSTEYVQSVLAHCLEEYTAARAHNYELEQSLFMLNKPTFYPELDDDDPNRPLMSSHYPSSGDDRVDPTEYSEFDEDEDGDEGQEEEEGEAKDSIACEQQSRRSHQEEMVDEDMLDSEVVGETDIVETVEQQARLFNRHPFHYRGPDSRIPPTRTVINEICTGLSVQCGSRTAQLYEMDARLEQIVYRLVEKCSADGRYKQAVGICLDCRRIDWLRIAIERIGPDQEKLEDAINYSMKCCSESEFIRTAARFWQKEVLTMCVTMLRQYVPSILSDSSTGTSVGGGGSGNQKRPDYFRILKSYVLLGESKRIAELIISLAFTPDLLPIALQLIMDTVNISSQHLINQILNYIHHERFKALSKHRAEREVQDNRENMSEAAENSESNAEEVQEEVEPENDVEFQMYEMFEEDESKSSEEEALLKKDDILLFNKLHVALTGSQMVYLTMQFLIRNNRADLHLLKFIKDHSRNMLCHGAVVIANGFMHCGTTCDQFLRDNLEWLGNAQNWARFTATASLGVIHRYHEREALRLMDAYLPKESGTSSPYAEGGGLYALGLIFAGHGNGEIIQYLEDAIKNAGDSPVIKHGACLGLGLLTLGTRNRKVLSLLTKEMLSIGDAVVGEAACMAIGMLMMGSRSRGTLSEMITQCEQVEHEKVSRGASIAIALVCFNERDRCKRTIATLLQNSNVFVRRAAMYAIGMAWIGTGHSESVRTLLHYAVSDVSDDVRRAAAESIGFVMYRQTPYKIIATMSLLHESYNPHVRYGSTIALGIAFAGTGNAEAIKLIETLTQDSVTFVRLGSYLAQAMIVGDLAEVACPHAKSVRIMLSRVIQDKHEDLMAKWGAIVAHGIIDACGRNASISLHCTSQPDLNCPVAAAGCLMFLHFWYWFPAAHMLSLAFKPSALIMVDQNLQPPEVEVQSSLSSVYFSYPPSLLETQRRGDKSGAAGDKLEAAVLSIRRQRRAGAAASSKSSGGSVVRSRNAANKEGPTPESPPITEKERKRTPSPRKITSGTSGAEARRHHRGTKLRNLTSVRRGYESSISFPVNGRFKPAYMQIKCGTAEPQASRRGMVVVVDTKPDAGSYRLMRMMKATSLPKESNQKEPEPPEPFEYIESEPVVVPTDSTPSK